MAAASDSYSAQFNGGPLDTIQLLVNTKNGDKNLVPAINLGFMELRNYVHFKPPLELNDTGQDFSAAEEEEWLEMAWFLEEDLHWVLKLPYHRFWSQVIYDESLHKCLESYLSQAPRYYDLDSLHLKEEILQALKKIHKLVFLIYLRMSTYKESKMHHIRPETFGQAIYENYIFDVPKIMDLCVLYGLQNLQIVSKMIQNIFATQPAYFEDLDNTSKIALEAFNTIEETLSKNLQEMHGTSSEYCVNGVTIKMEFSLSSFQDVNNYITDISATLHAFLEVFPSACQTFNQNGAPLRLTTFYELAFPAIEREIARRSKLKENKGILQEIKRKVSLSKTLLMKVFRNILNTCCIQNIFSESSKGNQKSGYSSSERFLEIFTEITSNKIFLNDYNFLYPFEADIELFHEVGLNLDQQRLSYIFCSIHDSEENMPQTFVSSAINGALPKTKTVNSSQKDTLSLYAAADILRGDKCTKKNVCNGISNSEANGLTDIEINSLIESVREILHNFDKDLIKKCLEYFNYDPDKVIDAYVTDTLPDHLKSEEETFEKEINGAEANSFHSILHERKCVYDNDEFDVMRRTDINLENVHIGKKNKTPSKYEALTKDKEFEFIKRYTLACGSEETEYLDEPNLYEDEYDDTYDSAMVGLKEPIPEGVPDIDLSEDKKGEEDSSGLSRDTSRDFCENPEVLRERAQQRWQSKMAARGARRGGGESSDPNRNRQNKDRHKANVANHNRRKQADFKKSRGMIHPN
ncbi:activating signal cointegrator 1 complex subunit 2-like isoform X1 [Argiope bruennichi]|uniref:activating signal cointegrator 1 complex subunit 2-like isoform X1 n=1 Tax=Argiope bruennichi TaxID=94029 RepID=UPI0024958C52|nr:activating signal cointegrator 1 complex subunit 2-like isoform X1 [Argiope bruennichi]XP_055939629.1 activating signal cointegrator 1 complex subunit 2-like isoform X1 [Argiope bruennichi]